MMGPLKVSESDIQIVNFQCQESSESFRKQFSLKKHYFFDNFNFCNKLLNFHREILVFEF